MNRKQITFDIDTKIAEQLLGAGYNKLYYQIKNFLKENGFEHIQGSVYTSKKPISNTQLTLIIKKLIKECPYLKKCVRDIRQTNITSNHSLNQYFDYDGTVGKVRSNLPKKKLNQGELHR